MRAENYVILYSRKRNVLNDRFGYIATSLEYLPAGTIIDGEIVNDFDALSGERPKLRTPHLELFASGAAQSV